MWGGRCEAQGASNGKDGGEQGGALTEGGASAKKCLPTHPLALAEFFFIFSPQFKFFPPASG